MHVVTRFIRWAGWKKPLAFLGFAGSLACLSYYSLRGNLSFPSPGLLLILLPLLLLEILCRGARISAAAYQITLKKIPLLEAIKINALGDLIAALTPARIGGDLSRVKLMKRDQINYYDIASIFAAEKGSDLIVLSTVLALLCWLIIQQGSTLFAWNSERNYLILLYLLPVIALLAAIIWLKKKGKIDYHELSWQTVVQINFYSLVHHLIRLSVLPLCIFYVDSNGSVLSSCFVSFVLVYAFALIPLPSGGGTVELAFMSFYRPLLGEGMAASTLLWWRFASHYFYVVWGAFFLVAPWFKQLFTVPIKASLEQFRSD